MLYSERQPDKDEAAIVSKLLAGTGVKEVTCARVSPNCFVGIDIQNIVDPKRKSEIAQQVITCRRISNYLSSKCLIVGHNIGRCIHWSEIDISKEEAPFANPIV